MTQWFNEPTSRPKWPDDLREWLGTVALLNLVLEAVQKVDWSFPPLQTLANQSREFRPQMLLTLLTYSYASGLYESEEIEARIYSDPTLRYLAARTFPDRRTLRRFRRRQRPLIKQCLIHVFKEAWKQQGGAGLEEPLAWPCYEATVGKPWFASADLRQIYFTAEERIDRAVFLDGMAVD
jgi:hypothetical protein